jgi:hypothetical protein
LHRRRGFGRGQDIPETLVNYLMATYFGLCRVAQRPPWNDLVLLNSEQLDIASFGIKGHKIEELREAIAIRAEEPELSNRKLAERVGVNPSQITRWVQAGRLPPKMQSVAP